MRFSIFGNDLSSALNLTTARTFLGAKGKNPAIRLSEQNYQEFEVALQAQRQVDDKSVGRDNKSVHRRMDPLRVETADEAAAIDKRIAQVWAGHPRYFRVEASPNFLTKASRARAILRAEIPVCCRQHLVPLLDSVPV